MRETTTPSHLTAPDFDPFAGPKLARVVPTTQPQLEIWTACQLGGDEASRAYNESISLRLTGPLNEDAFKEAWSSLVRRHEALRTTFSANGQQMCVSDEQTVELVSLNVADKDSGLREKAMAAYTSRDAHHLFDLQQGPLAKATLLKLADADWYFILTAHHIICDGWSTGILLQDLSKLYTAYAQGISPMLPAAPQLSQYAIEQQTAVTTKSYQASEAYWVSQFQGSVPVLNVPTDAPRPVPRTFASQRADFVVEAALANALKKVGIRAGSSFVGTLTAAFEVWLHQLTHQDDLVIGLPAAGQLVADRYGLVGHCVSLLPLRSQYSPGQSFIDYVKKRRVELMDAYEHQQLTFGSLLRKLPIARDPSRIALVPVVFNLDMGLDEGVDFLNVQHQLISNPRAYENFELSLNATGSEQSLVLEWSYNKHLFRPQTIEGFNQSFVALLHAVTGQPEQPLGAVEKAKVAEAPAVVSAPNALAYPREKALTTLLSETAGRLPNKVAIRFRQESLTFRQLDVQANQVAHALRAQGVRHGDRVGLAVDRSLPMVVCMLGILKAGATYVPVDPNHPADRLTYILTDAGCTVLLTSQVNQGRLALDNVRELLVETLWPTLNQYPQTAPEQAPTGQDIAYILYTSGTTGRPKGALIRHHSVANVLFSVAREPGLTEADKTIALATIAFDLAVVEIYTPLLVGAELLLIDPTTARNGEALAEVLSDKTITFIQTTPATLRLLLEAGWRGHDQLRLISCAEALPMDLAQTLLKLCRELWNYYGPTETTIYATGKQILPTDERITIGYAIANTRIYIVDESGNQAGEGQQGEICIAGEGVSGVYLNQPELTAEKFIDNPFVATPEKLYRTGDLGRYLNGGTPETADIVYLGRIDQQVKIRGFRIELGEIEHILAKVDGIKEAIVTAREDQPGDKRLVAYVVAESKPANGAKNGAAVATSEQIGNWRKQAARSLPNYMVPSDFVLLPRIPVTANGKIDRQALPAPSTTRTEPVNRKEEVTPEQVDRPATPEEQMLMTLWGDVLGIDKIGLDENFFELGGHSLIAVQVMARLEKQTGRRLPLATLFEYPTVRALAELIRENDKPVSWESLVPIKPTGTRQPLYIVHGAGLNVLLFNAVAQNLHPDQPVYGLQARGLNGIDEPFRSIKEMAAYYVAEIVKHNPSGPYSLSGFSFGGIVAYEMARQLVEQGREVGLLALFDAYAYDAGHNNPWWQRKMQQMQLFTNKVAHTMTLLEKHRWQGVNYKMQSIDRRLIKKYWWLKSSHRPDHVLLRMAIRAYWQMKFGQAQQQEAILDTTFKIEAINDVALDQFQLVPADLEVHLFRATIQTFYMDDYEYYGWRDFALKGVHVHDVPGEHSYIFAPPNDKEFARKLQAVLDGRAQ